ncbi:hypothetical protein CK203_027585 [Vitis vinifera]|uniref:DUF155 domain-containing protein n=1 Tax=Vitis vinifera TaxID=29760 RepID=A0A438JB46_VITVI|nr:hypothetical protein CK203_027585 [Vitis vinifera]
MQAEHWSNIVPPSSRSANYIVLRYYDFPSEITGIGGEDNVGCCHYMVVFQYGSAVLFNIVDNEVEAYLKIVRRYASGLLPEMRKDDYAVKQNPVLAEDMQGGTDYIVLKNLDIDGIRIIGRVLGQNINRGMEKTGTFTMDRRKLFQLVGKANSNLADVILKVGLFESTPRCDPENLNSRRLTSPLTALAHCLPFCLMETVSKQENQFLPNQHLPSPEQEKGQEPEYRDNLLF